MLGLDKNVIQVTISFEETAVICALLLRFRKKAKKNDVAMYVPCIV